MKLKTFALGACVLALAACGDKPQNPELLKGNSYVADGNGTNITLSFAENDMRVNGQVVNLYNGAYTASGANIQFGPMATTMMMGEPAAMQTEQDYFQFLSTVQTYELNGNRLTLKNNDGKEIVFQQVEPVVEAVVEETVVTE